MKKISLIEYIGDIDTVLVDASGVLYTDEGPVSGVPETIQRCRDLGKEVFLVTNNTSLNPDQIYRYLKKQGLDIERDHLLSSGLGLSLDPSLRAMIDRRAVYVYGWEGSKWYVEQAGGRIVSDPENADLIAILASYDEENDKEVSRLSTIIRDKDLPVICGNPDQYVMGVNGLIPVCGYYATAIEKAIQRDIIWMGKPYVQFSKVVETFLKSFQVELSEKVWFFDDNRENVDVMAETLGVSGCVVGTGLSAYKDLSEDATYQRYWLDTFTLDNT
ncbi:hypothetical protein DID77_01515 [Candidatus Marinamargulisbacteria bacterium SCGC AG-439-L15]|nr:hypothetical protein DID77_01515 [Candidatus Marinamargulisbacteria bacterium SCGC AG-439-L15]